MFKKGVVCISGVLALQHIVQGPEKQQEKDYFQQLLHKSDSTLLSRPSEV